LVGDRNGDHGVLRDQHFDAVIDCSGYKPGQIRATLHALLPGAPHYVFISSISAYAGFPPGQHFDEHAPLLQGEQGYGEEKARCEELLAAWMPGRCTIVRPGLIVGPHDHTGRFSYWPARIARGGAVLAPGRPTRPVQWIDARDLATWCVRVAVERTSGVFNALGPNIAMQDLLAACLEVCGSNASLHWVNDADLQIAGIEPWTGLPLWLPEHDAQFGGMLLGRNQSAVAAGLRCRPVTSTVRDTLHWLRSDPAAASAPTDALTAEREAELLRQHAG
jgi:2'-hydroxyisoflavone reductase